MTDLSLVGMLFGIHLQLLTLTFVLTGINVTLKRVANTLEESLIQRRINQ